MSTTPDTPSPWDLIDGILVINLDTDTERMEQFYADNTLLPQDKVHRLNACRGRELPGFGELPWFSEKTGARSGYWGGVAGCTMSHRTAIETAKERGWRNVLVLEDDVRFSQDPAAMKALRVALETLSGAYMLYLGYSRPTPYGSLVQQAEAHELWQVEGILSTYAYIASAPMYDKLLERMPDAHSIWEWTARHRAIDSFYRDIAAAMSGVRIYALLPDVVEHIDGAVSAISGDITYNVVDGAPYPHSYRSLRGALHLLTRPLHRAKIKLNSLRVYYRSRHSGFSGFRKQKD